VAVQRLEKELSRVRAERDASVVIENEGRIVVPPHMINMKLGIHTYIHTYMPPHMINVNPYIHTYIHTYVRTYRQQAARDGWRGQELWHMDND
jgi:hypothetical protein